MKLSDKTCIRIFAVSRQTISYWLQKWLEQVPDMRESLLPSEPDNMLDLDELWSFVSKKEQNYGSG